MTIQLYPAIGVPMLFNGLLILLAFYSLNSRMTSLESRMTDLENTEELRRGEPASQLTPTHRSRFVPYPLVLFAGLIRMWAFRPSSRGTPSTLPNAAKSSANRISSFLPKSV